MDGFELFVGACERQGFNGERFQSGKAHFDVYSVEALPDQAVQAEIAAVTKSLRSALQKSKSPEQRASLEEAIKNAPKVIAERKRGAREYRVYLQFLGTDPALGLYQWRQSGGQLEANRELIQRPDGRGSTESVFLDGNGGTLASTKYAYTSFQLFGRMQGDFANTMIGRALTESGLGKRSFDDAVVKKMYAEWRTLKDVNGMVLEKIGHCEE